MVIGFEDNRFSKKEAAKKIKCSAQHRIAAMVSRVFSGLAFVGRVRRLRHFCCGLKDTAGVPRGLCSAQNRVSLKALHHGGYTNRWVQ